MVSKVKPDPEFTGGNDGMPNQKGNLNNGQKRQQALDLSPVDGDDGFVGSVTGPALGMDVVMGKKGYSEDRPLWNTVSSFGADEKDNTGTGDAQIKPAGEDSRDEYASYKKPQTDEGLPQTYRTSAGAGDAGTTDSDEPDTNGTFGKSDDGGAVLETQKIGSEMPQTEYTSNDGGGAPLWKR